MEPARYKLSCPPSTRILHPTPLPGAKFFFFGEFSTPATTECALHLVDKLWPLGEQVYWDDPRDHQNCRLRDRGIWARHSKRPSPLYSGQTTFCWLFQVMCVVGVFPVLWPYCSCSFCFGGFFLAVFCFFFWTTVYSLKTGFIASPSSFLFFFVFEVPFGARGEADASLLLLLAAGEATKDANLHLASHSSCFAASKCSTIVCSLGRPCLISLLTLGFLRNAASIIFMSLRISSICFCCRATIPACIDP